MDWADSRKTRFRRAASRVKIASLVLAALSTVVLGINAIPANAAIALPMVGRWTRHSPAAGFPSAPSADSSAERPA
ncbi:hypothetical protein [Micromonospora sp. HK10]|uniref:hypothetical protein n=1 Tax=Micromonospora sp. HK10 TaxID=1538294 RepID=UPI000AA847DC|nr:hypothetical protein [Micromonospora sp. HK10]